MSVIALGAVALVIAAATAQNAAPTQQPHGTAREVVFTHYTALFSNAEILRRLLTPLAQEAVRNNLARTGRTLSPYPLDLANERFLVYVPSTPPPPHGYALLVFVSPWEQASLPFGWPPQLDRYGVIFVSAVHSGNAEAVLSRRVPLALSAEENIIREYPVDPRHIYVGGFSGGSRVAQRIALGYPDVFRGALLNSGADPLGVATPWGGPDPLPPRDLFLRFQDSSHLVYVSGELDDVNLASDAASLHSMREWCVFDVETQQTPRAAHELMSSAAFAQALDRLLHHTPPDHARLGACRSHIEEQLQESLSQAAALIAGGRHAAARKALLAIDERYGGLAAPRILALARSCGCGLAGP